MKDVIEVIKNVQGIYESDTAFTVLKDFERVLDELDLYVYKNWEDGELVAGPKIKRHWVICSFISEFVTCIVSFISFSTESDNLLMLSPTPLNESSRSVLNSLNILDASSDCFL